MRRSRVWAAPIMLGALMAVGLVIALVGEGGWDALACLAIAGALVYAGLKAFRPNA